MAIPMASSGSLTALDSVPRAKGFLEEAYGLHWKYSLSVSMRSSRVLFLGQDVRRSRLLSPKQRVWCLPFYPRTGHHLASPGIDEGGM